MAGQVSTQKESGYAWASLLFSLVGGGIFAVVFGVIALRRIQWSGGRLRGEKAARFGVILGSIETALLLGAVIVGTVHYFTTPASSDTATEVAATHRTPHVTTTRRTPPRVTIPIMPPTSGPTFKSTAEIIAAMAAHGVTCDSPHDVQQHDGSIPRYCDLANHDPVMVMTFASIGDQSWLVTNGEGQKPFAGPACVMGNRWIVCPTFAATHRRDDLAVIKGALGGELSPDSPAGNPRPGI